MTHRMAWHDPAITGNTPGVSTANPPNGAK